MQRTPPFLWRQPPNLSDVAWQELQRDRTGTKGVTLNARITVTRGAVTELSIKEATNGHTSTEVQRWIRQRWRVCSDIQWHSGAACLFRLIQRTSNQNLARARSQAVEDVFQSASRPISYSSIWRRYAMTGRGTIIMNQVSCFRLAGKAE
jgi:hypothetical protein